MQSQGIHKRRVTMPGQGLSRDPCKQDPLITITEWSSSEKLTEKNFSFEKRILLLRVASSQEQKQSAGRTPVEIKAHVSLCTEPRPSETTALFRSSSDKY